MPRRRIRTADAASRHLVVYVVVDGVEPSLLSLPMTVVRSMVRAADHPVFQISDMLTLNRSG